MACVTVKLVVLFVTGLVVPIAADDGGKLTASLSCKMDTTFQSPLEVKSSLKGGLVESVGSFRSALTGPLWPASSARALVLEKKWDKFTCTLTGALEGKPVGSVLYGGKEIAGATVKGVLSSPLKELDPTAKAIVQKDFGPVKCTVTSAALPLKGSELGTVNLGEKVKGFDCSLVGTINQKDGKVTVGNGKVAVKRSVDIDYGSIGPVCGVLETKLDEPTKVTGTVSWKKTIGNVCCNLQATSKGAFSCTLDTGGKFEHLKKKVATTEAPKKGWFGSEVAPEGSTTIPVVALIGFAVGGIITFFMLRPGRGKLTAGEQQLLA